MTRQTERGPLRGRALACLAAVALVGGLPTLSQAAEQAPTTTTTTTQGASAWGANAAGRLGDGTTLTRRTAVVVKTLGATAALAAGDVHSLALAEGGAVWAFGGNGYGQLGDGTITARTVPVRVTSLEKATAVAAGQSFSLAIRPDGTVAAWGRNSAGQLGDGTTATRRAPVPVSGLRGVTAVAAGDAHALAVGAGGEVWAWGGNAYGQLGDGTKTARRTPVKVTGLTDVLAVAAGSAHSLALRADGSVWAWGANGFGQLGDGTTALRTTPVQVTGLSDATAVVTGDQFSLALRRDGTVRGWGRNGYGQLGDGTVAARRAPVVVSGLSGVRRLTAGDNHALAVLATGSVRAWGLNSYGQLGDGTAKARRTPVPVKGVLDTGAIAAGTAHSLAAGPPPIMGPQPAGWWSGDVDGSDYAGESPVTLSTDVTTGPARVGCGFVLPVGGRLEAPDAAALEPGASFTFTTWLSPTDVTGTRVLAAKSDATRTAWSVAVVDGRLRFTASANGTDQRTVTSLDPVVVPERWQHVAVAYNGTLTEPLRVQLYVDGLPVAMQAFAPLSGPPSTVVALTAPTRFGGASWSGGLDEVRLFADPLSEVQVAETHAEDLARVDETCDRTAPVTTATPDQPASAAGWHRGPVELALEAGDGEDGAGVESLTWSATSAEIPGETVDGGSAAVSVTDEGVTTVTAAAVDLAGNAEVPQEFAVRIDTGAPSLSGRRTAAGPSGWSSAPVTVTWTCSDEMAGVADCPAATTVATEGADQSVHGVALDAAGNTAEATVSDIDVDTTAPLLTGTVDAPAGWSRDDVTVRWSATDALSGVADAPETSVITAEGAELTASAVATDVAGNTAAAVSPAVSIDRTAPVTTATAPAGWSRGAVVELTATDALSGVASTFWSLDGGALQSGTRVPVEGDGRHELTWFSTDVAGNVEPAGSVTVDVDTTAPVISAALSAAANAAGWHAAPVTVTFTCADGASGVASCSAPRTVDGEGAGQQVDGEAVDRAGNRSTTTTSVSLDLTAPAVAPAATRVPDANGWYAAPVEVGFHCTDALSGVATCPAPVRLGEGADQSVRGTGTDAAGHATEGVLEGVQVDLTPPLLSGNAGPSGTWSRDDVTVRWTCSDALSGIAGGCPADTVLTGEGDLAAAASVADLSGHVTTAVVRDVRIDRTAPVTSALEPAAAGSGWHAAAVEVALSATDALSGVGTTTWSLDGGDPAAYAGPVPVSGDGVHALRFWSTDVAGNVEAEQVVQLHLDGTAPVITAERSVEPGDGGWNRSAVEVRFRCADAQSGVSTCSEPVTVAADGADQVVRGTDVDAAGNTTFVEVSVSIDTLPPAVAVTGPVAGTSYVLGEAVPAVGCTADDAGSGVAAPCTVRTSAPPNGVGTWTATATAVDVAGNAATTTSSWSVVYGWGGWAPPLVTGPAGDAAGAGAVTVTAQAGSTLPVAFTLTDASGREVLPGSAPRWLQPRPAGEGASAATATKLALKGGRYKHEWKTDRAATGTWVAGVQLDDGTVRTFLVEFR